MENSISPQLKKKRKVLLLIPLFLIPFITIFFYALGGGKGKQNTSTPAPGATGYNTNIPNAHFKSSTDKMDKLSAYRKADEDSAKLKSLLREDPYNRNNIPSLPLASNAPSIKGSTQESKASFALNSPDTSANELLRRLENLKTSLQNNQSIGGPKSPAGETHSGNYSGGDDESKLRAAMTQLQSTKDTEQDPQLEKLNGMLDKILKIQHPLTENQGDSNTVASKPTLFSKVEKVTSSKNIKDLADNSETKKGFYSIDENDEDTITDNTISAVIQQDQTLVSGNTIEMRLLEDANINGIIIPVNTMVYGIASLNGERMNILISSIRHKNNIYPVAMQGYDLDGLAGLKIPGAITRDVAKETADQSINGIGLTSVDPSIGAQAASAGIQAAKTLISRKVRIVRVSVKAGYRVLLKNIKK